MIKITPFTRFIALLVIMALVNTSCSTFYNKRQSDVIQSQRLDYVQENSDYAYVVIHVGKTAMQMQAIQFFSNDSMSANVQYVDSTSMYHNLYDRTRDGRLQKIPNRDRQYAKQLHIYATAVTLDGGRIGIKESDIFRIERMQINHLAGVGTVVGIVVLSAAIALVAIYITLLIICNCPRVYTTDGERYNYSHSLFTGAVGSQMERNDYQVMPDYFPKSESYKFMIRNDLQEKQYTNKLQLVVAQHDKDVEIMAGQNGEIYSISQPIAPIKAVDDGGNDISHLLLNPDDESHAFNNNSSTTFSNAVLTFNKPKEDGNAKLVIRAKNHRWGAFVYDQFLQKFGNKYDEHVASNAKKSKEKIDATLKEQGIPLVVSVLKNGKWVDVESLNLIGDIAYNNVVIPLSNDVLTSGTDEVQIRLRSGYMFWEVDYVGIDFGPSKEFNVQVLSPTTATNGNESYVSQLAVDDDEYMEHLQMGDSAVIEFTGLVTTPELKRTIILNSKGYYVPTKVYEGKMQRSSLMKFKKEGAMSVFSRELADKYMNDMALDPTTN